MKLSQNKTHSVSEFKIHALELLEKVANSGITLSITKRGNLIALVVPAGKAPSKTQTPGGLAHTLVKEIDIISPLESDLWSANK